MHDLIHQRTVADLASACAAERLTGELVTAALARLCGGAGSPLADSLQDYLCVHLDEEISGSRAVASFRAELEQAAAACAATAIQAATAEVAILVDRKVRTRNRLLEQEAAQHQQAAAKAEEQQLLAKYEGKTLRCLRTAKGWSRTEVVERAAKHGGLCRSTYSNLELGFSKSGEKRRTSHAVVVSLAKAFGVTTDRIALAIEASYQLRANNPADPRLGPGRRRRRPY